MRAGWWTAFLRLYAVQGVWSYERMHGIGMAWAAEPLLDDLQRVDPQRWPEAVVRSAEPFNCHPHLAGLALGASVRAEYDGVPGPQIARLKNALGGPLGALGDQCFWAGLVPLLSGVALAATAIGAGFVGVLVLVLGYNVARFAAARWALETGLANGMQVSRAMQQSWLPKAASGIGPWAALAVGTAVPLVLRTSTLGLARGQVLAAAVLALGTAGAAYRLKAALPPIRIALLLAAAVLVFTLGEG
jgi:mannose/fructose/N-acetylgalactosamine-specific phosphotransferase system component IID